MMDDVRDTSLSPGQNEDEDGRNSTESWAHELPAEPRELQGRYFSTQTETLTIPAGQK